MADSGKAAAKPDNKLEGAIAKAERQVEKSPMDLAARNELAHAYLQAGRFESAVTTFRDAQYLGDDSARTALSLALAHVGAGQNSEAVALLDTWADSVPASDRGLALALAGETSRGVAVLSDALRAGEDSAKLRQNLAYAYALDGRWREARLMAAQDVPADELDARISDWARQGRPEDYRARVASMLSVPVRTDEGQPVHLALSRNPIEASVELASATAEDSELPPVEDGESFWVAEVARPETVMVSEPVVQSVVAAAPPAPTEDGLPDDTGFAQAFAEDPARPSLSFVSNPVVQSIPARKTREVPAKHALVPTLQRSGNSTHLVQLGSFRSEENAERAWGILVSRNPELANFDKTITQALVNGKKYWRVGASGFDRSAARSMCSTVKGRGGACFSYSNGRTLPGAITSE